MHALLERIETLGDVAGSVRLHGPGAHYIGPLEITVGPSAAPGRITWAVANRGDEPVRIRAIRLVFHVEHRGRLRMFRHGYQSWSASGVATLGVDVDPSSRSTDPALFIPRGMHHADATPVDNPYELRSEAVTLLADQSSERVLLGFLGGDRHDGTLRLRALRDAFGSAVAGQAELACEAFLGGARLDPGVERELHPVVVAVDLDQAGLLEGWATQVGRVAGARTSAPYQVGWCSWYHYFGAVSEADIRQNLAEADDWPFDVFQVDDGYQAAIGDWLVGNERFPSPLADLAGAIAAAGRRPGIWLAPFLAVPDSQVAQDHPEFVARHHGGGRLVVMFHPVWGGATHALDTTRPEVLDHLESVARSLVEMGYSYLKLDFTYAPSFDGVFADATQTPAERVRAGFDAIRRGAGDDAFILGCGAPLGATVGVVDGMRIGADVAPSWGLQAGQYQPTGYEDGEPATVNAWQNTLTRSFQHRRLWVNDPDCLMLRHDQTEMSPEAVRTWALAVGVSGGMALVSDDLGLLDADSRELLDEVLSLGRESDAAAIDGPPARCIDLLDHPIPGQLAAAGVVLEADPVTARSHLHPVD